MYSYVALKKLPSEMIEIMVLLPLFGSHVRTESSPYPQPLLRSCVKFLYLIIIFTSSNEKIMLHGSFFSRCNQIQKNTLKLHPFVKNIRKNQILDVFSHSKDIEFI